MPYPTRKDIQAIINTHYHEKKRVRDLRRHVLGPEKHIEMIEDILKTFDSDAPLTQAQLLELQKKLTEFSAVIDKDRRSGKVLALLLDYVNKSLLNEMVNSEVDDEHPAGALGADREDGLLTYLKQIHAENPEALINLLKEKQGDGLGSLFCIISEKGYIAILAWIKETVPNHILSLIRLQEYASFYSAASSGHVNVLAWHKENAGDDLMPMTEHDEYSAFLLAAWHGHLRALEWFSANFGDELVKQMICVNDWQAFRWAASAGKLEVLQWMLEKSPGSIRKMIGNAVDFLEVVRGGHTHVLSWYKSVDSQETDNLLYVARYQDVEEAIKNGHLGTLIWLRENKKLDDAFFIKFLNGETICGMSTLFQRVTIHGFAIAAKQGYLDMLNWMLEQFPAERDALIEQSDYYAFRCAAAAGELRSLQWLYEVATPKQKQAMLLANEYCVFRYAAKNGSVETLNWLKSVVPEMLPAMIEARDYTDFFGVYGQNYQAFLNAMGQGHIEVVDWLINNVKDPIKMIESDGYDGFTQAAENGRFDLVQWFAEKYPKHLPKMITADDSAALKAATKNNHAALVDWMQDKISGHSGALKEKQRTSSQGLFGRLFSNKAAPGVTISALKPPGH